MERHLDDADRFAGALATVRPARPLLDRDRLMFDAGATQARREVRRRAGYVGIALGLVGLLGLGGWNLERRRATDLERTVAELRARPSDFRTDPLEGAPSSPGRPVDTLVTLPAQDDAAHSVRGWTARLDRSSGDPVTSPLRDDASSPPRINDSVRKAVGLRADAWRSNASTFGDL